jgi:hypothetical protein
MSSLFEGEVRDRRELATPWAHIDFERFVRSVGLYDEGVPGEDGQVRRGVMFTAVPRPSVQSRMWYTLEWTGEDEKRHMVESQYFDLLMWRAAHLETNIRQAEERQAAGQRVRKD